MENKMFLVVMSDLEGDHPPEDVGLCETEDFAKEFCRYANRAEVRWSYNYYKLKVLSKDDLHT